MSSVYMLLAACVSCGQLFTSNPDRVPSIRVNAQRQPDPTGRREPVCRTCWDRRVAHRRANGLPEEYLMPGAYAPVSDLSEEEHDGD